MKNKFSNLYANKTLFNFLLIILLSITTIVAFSSFVYYFYLNNILTDFYIKHITTYQESTLDNINQFAAQIPKISLQILEDNDTRQLLFYDDTSDSTIYKSANSLNSHKFHNGIKRVTIYNKKSELVYSDSDLRPISTMEYLSQNKNFQHILDNIENNTLNFSIDNKNIYFIHSDFRGFYIIYEFSETIFLTNILPTTNIENCDTAIFYNSQTPFFVTNSEKVDFFASAIKDISFTNSYTTYNSYMLKKSHMGNAAVLSAISNKEINAKNMSTLFTVLTIALCLIAIGFLIIIFYYRYFNNKLDKLITITSIFGTKNDKPLSSALASAFNEGICNEDEKNTISTHIASGYLRCIIIQIDDYSSVLYKNTYTSVSLMLTGLGNMISDILNKFAFCYYTSISSDSLGLIISSSNSMSDEQTEELLANVSKKSNEIFYSSFTFTISNEFTDVHELIFKCRKMNTLKRYRYLSGYGSIIYEKMNYDIQPEKLKYPLALENMITVALDNHNVEDYRELLNQFMLIINLCNYDYAREWILTLTTKLIKESTYLKSSPKIDFDLIVSLSQHDVLEETIVALESLLPEYDAYTSKTPCEDNMREQINQIIDCEFSNPMFSLNFLAEKFNISTSYMGQKFKKSFGMTFNAYLADYRIKKAMEMLRDTNMKISDISTTCGYSSTTYFIKIFKQHVMVTPQKYRDSIK